MCQRIQRVCTISYIQPLHVLYIYMYILASLSHVHRNTRVEIQTRVYTYRNGGRKIALPFYLLCFFLLITIFLCIVHLKSTKMHQFSTFIKLPRYREAWAWEGGLWSSNLTQDTRIQVCISHYVAFN